MSFSFIPKTIYKTKSPINGEIFVEALLGRKSIKIGGLEQSGPMVKGIWKKTLKKIQNPKSEIRNCLILGLCGGTVASLAKNFWPETKIVGVEIDPEIVKVGKKYLNLSQIDGLKIEITDAIRWISHYNTEAYYSKKFDLVVVDMYLGDQFPKKAEGEAFLKRLKKLLSPNGVVIFNRLRTDDNQRFENNLGKVFSRVDLVKTSTNFLFLARS